MTEFEPKKTRLNGKFSPAAVDLFSGTPTYVTKEIRATIVDEFEKLDKEIMATRDKLISEAMQVIQEKREKQIIEVLKQQGHTLDTREQIEQFFKTRCSIVVPFHGSDIRVLQVDTKPICQWHDTINVHLDDTGVNNIIIIAGE